MSDFDQAFAQFPLEWRCCQADTGQFQSYPLDFCFFGVPSYDLYGRVPLERMPPAPPGVAFLANSQHVPLIHAFVKSPYAQTIQTLSIGASSYNYGTRLYYADAIALLKDARLPQLKTLQLGVWELFSNSHCAYGRLGDVTEALATVAAIETLGLFGHFDLSRSLHFHRLQKLYVESNDPITGINGGPIANETFHHLLRSEMPHLEEAALIFMLCDDDQPRYTFPDTFLEGENVPQLRLFEIDAQALASGEGERLLNSPLGQRPGIRILLDQD